MPKHVHIYDHRRNGLARAFGLVRDGTWRLVDMDGHDWGTWSASSLEDALRQLRADVARRPGAYMGRPNEESIRKAIRLGGADASPDIARLKQQIEAGKMTTNEANKEMERLGLKARFVWGGKGEVRTTEVPERDAASNRFDQLVRQLLSEKKTRADLEAALQREKATAEEKSAAVALFERLTKDSDEGADPAEMEQLFTFAAKCAKEGKPRAVLEQELAKHPRLTQSQRGAVIADFNSHARGG